MQASEFWSPLVIMLVIAVIILFQYACGCGSLDYVSKHASASLAVFKAQCVVASMAVYVTWGFTVPAFMVYGLNI